MSHSFSVESARPRPREQTEQIVPGRCGAPEGAALLQKIQDSAAVLLCYCAACQLTTADQLEIGDRFECVPTERRKVVLMTKQNVISVERCGVQTGCIH